MNTITSVGRWLSVTVASVLAYLNVLKLSGTEEELKSLHAAVDASFTVIQPIQYAVRFSDGTTNYIMCMNRFSQNLDGIREVSVDYRIQRFNTVAEVKDELRKRTAPTSWAYNNISIVEIQGNKVLRVVEPATLGEPKKFAVAWIYHCGEGRHFACCGMSNMLGAGNAHVQNAVSFSSIAEAHTFAMLTQEGAVKFTDVRLCIFDITDKNDIKEIEEVVRVKPLEYVVRYDYGTGGKIGKYPMFLGGSIGNGVEEINRARRFATTTDAMKAITFADKSVKDQCSIIQIVEVNGGDIIRVVA